MLTIATHNNRFHADDVYAVATLRRYFEDGRGEGVRVIRTREPDRIREADIVVDVGGVYDPDTQRYDHHQGDVIGRDNDVPYAAFGLVWRAYGTAVCGTEEVAAAIEESLVQPIDAQDNGVALYDLRFPDVDVYDIADFIESFVPTYTESELTDDEQFEQVVAIARQHLGRLIAHKQAVETARETVEEAYREAPDKRIIELSYPVPWKEVIRQYPEPLYVVFPVEVDGAEQWYIRAVPAENDRFENRKDLPAAWAGREGEELRQVTGVADAVFAHKAGFIMGVRSRESALELARRAADGAA